MTIALTVVVLVAVVIVAAQLAERLGIQPPLFLLGVGVIACLVPGVPVIELSPEVVLLGLLPPLLYAAALSTSLVDIRANLGSILSLAFGLVLFTALIVGAITHYVLDVHWGVAIALGAIVAPPDAVAATAVARRVGLPRRVTTILEGESLLNDATSLVTLRTALAAAGLAVAHGEGAATHPEPVGPADVAQSFAVAVVGGVAVGVVVFLLVGWLRRRVHESAADTALSFVAPFAAYLPAEEIGASGVLAVVTAGLLLAHKAPLLQTASSRLSERINWASITFILENLVFLLIGLQVKAIITGVREDDVALGNAFLLGLAVLVAAMIARPLWLLPMTWLRRVVGRDEQAADNTSTLVVSWAGMRGVVTLAAALTLPQNTPHRPVFILVALMVTVGTLVLQGLTLPTVARRLDVRGPDAREDALQEATVVQATTAAGLRAIESRSEVDTSTFELIQRQATARVNRVWERLGSGRDDEETPSETYQRIRLEMLAAERTELLRIRDEDSVDQAVLRTVLQQLDAEEAALAYRVSRHERLRDEVLTTPSQVAGNCDHLRDDQGFAVPTTPEGCEECRALGMTWVHLRLCTTCGHVGCCDSSQGRHASAHFHESAHPVMRSLEPGESWRWCFVDEVLG